VATDIGAIIANLLRVYDPRGRTLVEVGAGGGQFIDYGLRAARVLAVDCDGDALRRLGEALAGRDARAVYAPVQAEFLSFTTPADAVLFEFSLHEMDDPARALAHARTLAAEVLVIDHWRDSPWAWQVVEEEKVARSTRAVLAANPSLVEVHQAEQRFAAHAELLAKVAGQGPLALERAARYRDVSPISIPMAYWIARCGRRRES
jgi:hypothetical protein